MSSFAEILTNISLVLPELTNTSATAIHRKIAEVVSLTIDSVRDEITNSEAIINNTLDSDKYGKLGYYTSKALGYQDGDNLIVGDNFDNTYATVDTSKQIIKQASAEVVNTSGTQYIVLKVAAFDTEENKLVKLTDLQKASFDSYFMNFEILGIPVTKISGDANIINGNLKITYLSNYNLNTIKSLVSEKLTEFTNTFQFNGLFYINDLEAFLRSQVQGVRNVYFSSVTVTNQAGVPIPINEFATLTYGYFYFNDNLLPNINYVAI